MATAKKPASEPEDSQPGKSDEDPDLDLDEFEDEDERNEAERLAKEDQAKREAFERGEVPASKREGQIPPIG